MKRTTTLQDVARKLGFSTTTISLALRDHPRISAETKDKVRRAIEDLNYHPNQVARALVVGKSNLVGVIVPNSSDPYYSEVFKGIEDAVRAANYHVLLSNGGYDLAEYAARVREMMGLRVGGIIAAPPLTSERQRLPEFWLRLRSREFPLVLINRLLIPPVFGQVLADYRSGVRDVVTALSKLGHRRVAYISGEPPLLPIRQRLNWFRQFARQAKFDDDPALLMCSPLNLRGGYHAAQSLYTSGAPKPTAIVAFSDTVAVGVLRYLQEQSVRVPEEVSVIGFDGTELSGFTTPSLSTVVTPMYDIGTRAFEVLLEAVDGRRRQDTVLLPTELMLRESVGPAPKAT